MHTKFLLALPLGENHIGYSSIRETVGACVSSLVKMEEQSNGESISLALMKKGKGRDTKIDPNKCLIYVMLNMDMDTGRRPMMGSNFITNWWQNRDKYGKESWPRKFTASIKKIKDIAGDSMKHSCGDTYEKFTPDDFRKLFALVDPVQFRQNDSHLRHTFKKHELLFTDLTSKAFESAGDDFEGAISVLTSVEAYFIKNYDTIGEDQRSPFIEQAVDKTLKIATSPKDLDQLIANVKNFESECQKSLANGTCKKIISSINAKVVGKMSQNVKTFRGLTKLWLRIFHPDAVIYVFVHDKMESMIDEKLKSGNSIEELTNLFTDAEEFVQTHKQQMTNEQYESANTKIQSIFDKTLEYATTTEELNTLQNLISKNSRDYWQDLSEKDHAAAKITLEARKKSIASKMKKYKLITGPSKTSAERWKLSA